MEGVEVKLRVSFTSALDGGEYSVSRSGCFITGEGDRDSGSQSRPRLALLLNVCPRRWIHKISERKSNL
jgi:hypothetical protein